MEQQSAAPPGREKLKKYFAKGVISVGSAYSYEDRFKSFDSSALTLFAQDWFGWQSVAEKSSRFPGSTWIEARKPVRRWRRETFSAWAISRKGVVAKRFSRATLVPYLEANFLN